MPSAQITNQSGGMLLVSGNFFSGVFRPQGGCQIRADRANSGNIYVALSGGVTVGSGSYPLSGGIYSGALDGMELGPGDAYWIPAIAWSNKAGPTSGTPSIYVATDAAASGFARVWFEIF